jgi:hypothetical protein
MALNLFNYDMDIISKLEDEPNDVGGMEADALKAKFDEGGKAIQTYINEELVPNIVNGHHIEDKYGEKLETRPVLRFINAQVKVEPDAIVIDPANGKDGVDGTDGKSAYGTAQEGGYTGTESEFATDLATVSDKADPDKMVSITMVAANWSELEIGFKQTVSVPNGTAKTLVSLQPTPAQIVLLMEAGVTALMVNNNGGTFEAHAIGEKPEFDLTIQATLAEVDG